MFVNNYLFSETPSNICTTLICWKSREDRRAATVTLNLVDDAGVETVGHGVDEASFQIVVARLKICFSVAELL